MSSNWPISSFMKNTNKWSIALIFQGINFLIENDKYKMQQAVYDFTYFLNIAYT